MRPELLSELSAIMRGEIAPKTGVAHVAGVAGVARYASKPAELRQLRPLRLKNTELGKHVAEGVALTSVADRAEAEIDEREGLAADRVPAVYLDAWSQLCCQRPERISEEVWRRALNDGGLLLDRWGRRAEALGWTPGDLFDCPGSVLGAGLIWRLQGAQVVAMTEGMAAIEGGSIQVAYFARARPRTRCAPQRNGTTRSRTMTDASRGN
jgi:hypothetical protein